MRKINMSLDLVIEKIKLAAQSISDNSPLVWHQNEWAICARLRASIAEQFPDYDIDNELIKDDGRRPDIVIHELGVHERNLVAIEVKKNPTTKQIAQDINKIIETLFRPPYLYSYGVFISIGKLPELPPFDKSRIRILEIYGWKIEPPKKKEGQ